MASESGQEKRETLADIVSEIRAYGAQPPPRLMWLEIADRIEAIDSADAWRSLYTPPVGNAAAMREALVKIRRELNDYCNGCTLLDRMTEDPPDYTCLRDSLLEIERIVAAALSAPARNCDVYKNKKDAEAAFLSEECRHPCGCCTVSDDYGCALVHDCGVDWLFAPAAERKGECDGR